MGNSKPEYIFFNGNLIPYEQATIHVMTPGVKYGAMVFEGIRCYWNESEELLYVFKLKEHAKRLMQSTKLLRMEHDLTADHCIEANIKLLKKLNFNQDAYIRQMIVLDGDGPVTSSGPVNLISVASPRGRKKGFERGLNVSISSWVRIDDTMMPPRIKAAASYQNSRLGAIQAKLDGYDSTIFLTKQGKVSEGSGASLFMVRDSKVITPPITSSILESITRSTLIHLSKELLNEEVIERDIDRTELYVADEVFFCGTGAEIIPITMIDHNIIGNGNIGEYTRKIRELYFDIVRGYNKNYSDWRTLVFD